MTLGKSGVKVFNGKTYRFDSSFGRFRLATARRDWLKRQGFLVRVTEGTLKAELGGKPTTLMIWRVWRGPKRKRR